MRAERAVVTVVLLVVLSATLHAQVFTTMVGFNGTNGGQPDAPVIQGLDGDIYGTAAIAGPDGGGEIFKVSPAGALTVLFPFCGAPGCADGSIPYGGLLLTRDGDLYGTTYNGGAGWGNVYKITPGLVGTDLADFANKNGANPEWSLTQGTDGNFYGIAFAGGVQQYCGGCGGVFRVTPQGKLTFLHYFCSETNCADGYAPEGSLLQASDGSFYGETTWGGTGCLFGQGCGTIFKITAQGVFTTIYGFTGAADGSNPQAMSLVQGSDGDLYGTTSYGGANETCISFGVAVGCGVIFKMTTSGALTTLYSFCALANCADGYAPRAGLIQATDGNFYGTTWTGGAYNEGTIFRITPSGVYSRLYSFCAESGCPDGAQPQAPLFQAGDGRLYGTTQGPYIGVNQGTVFRFNLGLPASVAPLPAFGKVAQTISILGYNLEHASSVTFNGVSATFTAVSSTQLTAVVPSGAASGAITVVTPGGTLSSKPFNVLP